MLYMVGIGNKLDRGDAIKNLRNPEFRVDDGKVHCNLSVQYYHKS
jgi:hypothetical protein